MITDHAECTFASLRYSFGGDHPSQTTHHTLSPGHPGLEPKCRKGGISTTTSIVNRECESEGCGSCAGWYLLVWCVMLLACVMFGFVIDINDFFECMIALQYIFFV